MLQRYGRRPEDAQPVIRHDCLRKRFIILRCSSPGSMGRELIARTHCWSVLTRVGEVASSKARYATGARTSSPAMPNIFNRRSHNRARPRVLQQHWRSSRFSARRRNSSGTERAARDAAQKSTASLRSACGLHRWRGPRAIAPRLDSCQNGVIRRPDAAWYAEGPRSVRQRAPLQRRQQSACSEARVKQLFLRRVEGVEVRVENRLWDHLCLAFRHGAKIQRNHAGSKVFENSTFRSEAESKVLVRPRARDREGYAARSTNGSSGLLTRTTRVPYAGRPGTLT